MERRRFVLSALVRDRILVTGVLAVFFLCGVFVKEDLPRMYLMTASSMAALILSFVYVITNRPLTRREVVGEAVLNCLIIMAMTNFIYKILYVY